MSANGKSEEQAAIENLDLPCPRCGSLDMLIRHPMVLEQSMVAIPAYSNAEVTPHGFKASLDQQLQKRFERATLPKVVQPPQPDLLPMLIAAYSSAGELTLLVAEMQLRVAKAAMEERDDCRCDEFYPDQCPSCLAKSQSMGMADTSDFDKGEEYTKCPVCKQRILDMSGEASDGNPDDWHYHMYSEHPGYLKDEAKGGSLEDFPLIQKRKNEGMEEERGDWAGEICPNCHVAGGADGHCYNCDSDYVSEPEPRRGASD